MDSRLFPSKFYSSQILRYKEGVQLRWMFPVVESSSDPVPSSKSSEKGGKYMHDELYDSEKGGEGKSQRKISNLVKDKMS